MQRKKASKAKKATPKKPAKAPPRAVAKKKKKATRHQGGQLQPAHMDPALRQAYLEAYAGRDASQRLSRLNTRLHINSRTVDEWRKDEAFLEEIQAIDDRRLQAALSIATTNWPTILQVQADIAANLTKPAPRLEAYKKPAEWVAAMEVWQAQSIKVLGMSTRAAELVADVIGVRKKANTEVHVHDGKAFAGPPVDEEGLLKERQRLMEVEERAIARREARSGPAGSNST